jgi:Arc/MetJ-type ribon-helix-helix transcriptional regulator
LAYVESMTVELKPELERKIQEQLANGQFNSVDEVLAAALDRLPSKELPANPTAVERLIEFSRTRSVKLPAGETVESLVRELRASS